jgi:hypothetical protein
VGPTCLAGSPNPFDIDTTRSGCLLPAARNGAHRRGACVIGDVMCDWEQLWASAGAICLARCEPAKTGGGAELEAGACSRKIWRWLVP